MERMRVLIADDDSVVAETLRDEVERLGHQVVALARDGAEAVELTRRTRPDSAILDIKMPKMDGLAAAAEILKENPIPIIVLTGFVDDDLVDRASQAGVLAYLTKPAEAQQLRATLAVARRRFEEFSALRREITDLQEALETRKLVERAKGILMQRLSLPEADAFRRLQKRARDTNQKLGAVAQAVIAANDLM
jgi:response regulator NasT